MAKKTKRSWTYQRENEMDLLYSFLHPGFSIVASLAHTEEFFKKTIRSRTYMREKRVDSPYLFTLLACACW